jgi:hypothetical protein
VFSVATERPSLVALAARRWRRARTTAARSTSWDRGALRAVFVPLRRSAKRARGCSRSTMPAACSSSCSPSSPPCPRSAAISCPVPLSMIAIGHNIEPAAFRRLSVIRIAPPSRSVLGSMCARVRRRAGARAALGARSRAWRCNASFCGGLKQCAAPRSFRSRSTRIRAKRG